MIRALLVCRNSHIVSKRWPESRVNARAPRIDYSYRALSSEGEPVTHTLDQDVQALKQWLRRAWRYLAQPSITRFDRQEMRQQMKLVEEKLRIALQKVAAANRIAAEAKLDLRSPRLDWHLLKIET